VCSASGTWTLIGFDVSSQPESQVTGDFVVLVTQFDAAGNGSGDQRNGTKDTVGPAVTLNSTWGYVSNGQHYVNSANQNNITFSGTCENGIAVQISTGGVPIVAGCSGGVWSRGGLSLSGLPEGALTVEVSQTDAASNTGSVTQTGTKDTLAPGATGGEAVSIGITTNRGTRNYEVRQFRIGGVTLYDGQLYPLNNIFTDSNFPTFSISCTSGCQTGGSINFNNPPYNSLLKKDLVPLIVNQCSQYFQSGCTATFSSADLRLKTQPTGNNAIWDIDISFLKDLAGNSPPSPTWRTFDVLNLPPFIYAQ
jgi:hypothetical protein